MTMYVPYLSIYDECGKQIQRKSWCVSDQQVNALCIVLLLSRVIHC